MPVVSQVQRLLAPNDCSRGQLPFGSCRKNSYMGLEQPVDVAVQCTMAPTPVGDVTSEDTEEVPHSGVRFEVARMVPPRPTTNAWLRSGTEIARKKFCVCRSTKDQFVPSVVITIWPESPAATQTDRTQLTPYSVNPTPDVCAVHAVPNVLVVTTMPRTPTA